MNVRYSFFKIYNEVIMTLTGVHTRGEYMKYNLLENRVF